MHIFATWGRQKANCGLCSSKSLRGETSAVRVPTGRVFKIRIFVVHNCHDNVRKPRPISKFAKDMNGWPIFPLPTPLERSGKGVGRGNGRYDILNCNKDI